MKHILLLSNVYCYYANITTGAMAGHAQNLLFILLFYLSAIARLQPQTCLGSNSLYAENKTRMWRIKIDFGRIYYTMFKVQLNRIKVASDKNIFYPVLKATKHDRVLLAFPDKLFQLDVTICVDVLGNPGPCPLV